MLTHHDILWSIIAPAIIAILAMLISHFPPWRRDAKTQPYGPALAVACAFAIAFTGIAGWPRFPPIAVEGWLPYLALFSVLLAIAVTFVGSDRGIFGAFILALAARALMRSQPPRPIWIILIAAIALIVWCVVMDYLAAKAPGPGLPILLAFFAAGAAIVLVDSGTQSFGQLAGAIAIALGFIGVSGFWFRRLTLSRGGILALTITLMGLILCGHLVADVKCRDLFVLAAAPLSLWSVQLPVINRRPWRRFIVGAIVMTLVLSISVAPAMKGLIKTMKEQTESYQY